MIKVEYICDLCGVEYKNRLNWTLERDTITTETYSDNRKEVLQICGKCARWIKKQRGRAQRSST